MAVIESVAARQRGAYDFEGHYDNLCALQSSCPLPAVKAHLADGVLDINGDRIRSTDWVPILNSLRINRTLKFVAVRSYYQHKIDEQNEKLENGRALRQKLPAIRSKEITYRLCKGLKECLQVSRAIQCIELQGLPLRERDLMCLAKGVMKNNTLTHLALEYCGIGDDGMKIVCQGVKNSATITSLNLTGCNLSWRGMEVLAKVIKHQAMRRHNEAWQDSLRYRRPDLDRMPGIRRISVNANPMMGDRGALLLAEALKDDLWLKALDLQQCGISTEGAKTLLDVLKYNTTIVVLDVRQNPMIDRETMQNIMEQVMINSNGQESEYKWVKVEPPHDPATVSRPKLRKRTKTLASSFGRKTIIKVTPSRKRSKTSAGVSRSLQPINSEAVKPGPGMPWRTALRANRYRGYPPEESPGRPHMMERQVSSPDASPGQPGTSITVSQSEPGDDTDGPSLMDWEPDTGGKEMKKLKVELEQLRRRFQEEREARARADQKVLELSLENTRLQAEVEQLRSKGGGLLEDDHVLDSIESSFQQFHAFLDLLKEAGLGQLIAWAGIDQASMPFASTPQQPQRAPPALGSLISSSAITPDMAPVSKSSLIQHGMLSLPADPNNVRPNVVPGNYINARDPTMGGQGVDAQMEAPPGAKFDELYERVLRETEGALAQGDTGANQVKMGIPLRTKPQGPPPQLETIAADGMHSHGDHQQMPSQGSIHASLSSQPENDDRLSSHSAPGSNDGRHTARGEILQDIDTLSIGSNRSKHSAGSNHSERSGGSAGSKPSSKSRNTGSTQVMAARDNQGAAGRDSGKPPGRPEDVYSENFEITHSEISEDIEEIREDINPIGSEPDDF